MGNAGVNRLARVLHSRIKQAADSPPALDMGRIGADGSLTCGTFPVPIPAGDYLICRGAAHKEVVFATTSDGASVPLPVGMVAVKAGDSVLVAWVGNVAIVVDVLVSAKGVTA